MKISLERETLHLMDDKQRIALIETLTIDQGNVFLTLEPAQRYQFANHLGSASLELDEAAGVLSYEEYAPYGSTVYQTGRSAAESSLKRYRYTGKERDEETGLSYHGLRYCAPWLGRWVSCDPLARVDGVSLYQYAGMNPLNASDPTGAQEEGTVTIHEVTVVGRSEEQIGQDIRVRTGDDPQNLALSLGLGPITNSVLQAELEAPQPACLSA